MAAAEPGDAAEPAASPDLRRGLPLRPPADRPAAEAAGPADHRQADPPAGGVPGADPRPAAGVHHLGAVRGQPGAARRPTGPGTTGRARRGRGRRCWPGCCGAGGAGGGWCVRYSGPKDRHVVHLHPRRRPTTPSRSARASPGRCSTTWSPARSWRRSSRRRWRRAWRRWPRSSGERAELTRHWQLRRERARVRGRPGGPAVPGVRAGEPAGGPRAGAALGGGAEGRSGSSRTSTSGGSGRPPAGSRPTTSGRSGRWPPTCRRCGRRRRPRPRSGSGSPGC